MKIEIPFKIKKGKVIENNYKIRDHITSLDDGSYVLIIQNVNELVTERDYQNAYFAMIDICVASTGNDKYTIHEAFKKEYGVTTTSNFSTSEWRNYLDKFKYWCYNNLDIIV